MRKTLLTTPWIGTCLAAAAAMLFVAGPAAAQSMATAAPTYSKDIAPIVQDVCMRCHVEGGLGPFLLTNYQEVRRYAQRIRQSVLQRSMPPWHLDPTIGIQAFNNDISLSREEVDAVIAWVDAGAPEGVPGEGFG